jgi:hypothetical protein
VILYSNEAATLIRLSEAKTPDLAPLTKLWLVRSDSRKVVAAVLRADDMLKRQIMEQGTSDGQNLSHRLNELWPGVDSLFGSNAISEDLETEATPTSIAPLCDDAEKFLEKYKSIKSRLVYFDCLSESYLRRKLISPSWTIEEFAQHSVGWKPKKIASSQHSLKSEKREDPKSFKREYSRRLALLSRANKLPPDRAGHLASDESPERFMEWASGRSDFECSSVLADWWNKNDRSSTSGQTKIIRSLQRLCMILAANIREPRGNRPIYDPGAEKSTFISYLVSGSAEILDKELATDSKTLLTHLRDAFDSLDKRSADAWLALWNRQARADNPLMRDKKLRRRNKKAKTKQTLKPK